MLTPGETIKSYEVLRQVAEGGFAVVWQVRHTVLGSLHALKILKPELVARSDIRQRFLDEGRVMAQLAHPNIVRVTDTIAEPGIAGLVLEWVDGPTLASWVAARTSPPSGPELRALLIPVLDAVGFAHGRGVVHRDIKPDNILLASDAYGGPVPRILDFGVARVRGELDQKQSRRHTHSGVQIGTLRYMSPEQVRSSRTVDARSDIFAIGATFFEVATLRPAFDGDDDYEVMRAIVEGDRVEDPGLRARDPVLATALARAMEVDPARRFASCAEMSAAIEPRSRSVWEAAPAPAPTAGPRRPETVAAPMERAPRVRTEEQPAAPITWAPPKPRRSHPMRWVAALVLLAVAVAGLAASGVLTGLTVLSLPGTTRPPPSAFPASGAGGSLEVGTGREGLPWFDTTGEAQGFDIDLAKALAARMGKTSLKLEADIDPRTLVRSGAVDLAVAALSIDSDQSKGVRYSRAYASPTLMVVRASSRPKTVRPLLAGFSCAIAPIQVVERARLQPTRCELVAASTPMDSLRMVFQGRADLTVVDAGRAHWYGSDLVDTGVHLGADAYGIAVRADNVALLTAVNEVLAGLEADGTLARLGETWGME